MSQPEARFRPLFVWFVLASLLREVRSHDSFRAFAIAHPKHSASLSLAIEKLFFLRLWIEKGTSHTSVLCRKNKNKGNTTGHEKMLAGTLRLTWPLLCEAFGRNHSRKETRKSGDKHTTNSAHKQEQPYVLQEQLPNQQYCRHGQLLLPRQGCARCLSHIQQQQHFIERITTSVFPNPPSAERPQCNRHRKFQCVLKTLSQATRRRR